MSAKEPGPPVRQEEDRIRSLPITLVLLTAVLLGSALVLWGWLELRAGERARFPAGMPRAGRVHTGSAEVGGVNQTLIDADTAAKGFAARQRALLESYGWVDSARGIARIPIERAMQAIVEGARP